MSKTRTSWRFVVVGVMLFVTLLLPHLSPVSSPATAHADNDPSVTVTTTPTATPTPNGRGGERDDDDI